MLKYFLPDWEDRLDPDFDFKKDQYSDGHRKNPYEYDHYAHQIYEKPPYDGMLVSLAIFEKKIALNHNGKTFTIRGKPNVKEYLKIPDDSSLEIMGDCGAFGYVKEKKPPEPFYSVENVSNLYQSLGFDYGVSVDHLAVDYVFINNPKTGKREKKALSKNEKDRRIKITLDNAAKFLKLHGNKNYDFKPIGVAQGYDINTYKKSVEHIVDLGYEYLALGGLVHYKTDFILKILENIQDYIKDINIHLFGVLRPDYLSIFEELGVTSFDSTSYFRKAWLRSGQNYLSVDGKWYSAIRVPQSSNSRLLKNADFNGSSLDKIKGLENNALQSLFKYDNGEITAEEALDVVMTYDEPFLRNSDGENNLREKYLRVLKERPWKKCDCPMCKSLGINVIIFRGTNRNKRRGFHNLWAFRNYYKPQQTSLEMESLQNKTKDALCIVPCGSSKIWDKNPNAGPTIAEDVYQGTFSKKCQEYAKKFYSDSWCILSAKYGFLMPYDEVEGPYNVTFNDNSTNPILPDVLVDQLIEKKLDNYEKIVVVAGKNYENILKSVFNDKEIYNPLSGCKGIGYMMNRLSVLINE